MRFVSSVFSLLLVTGISSAAELPSGYPSEMQALTAELQTMATDGRSGYLGVGIAEIDSERARELKLSEERGVYVTRVEPESPAAKAGIAEGDVLLKFGLEALEGTEQLGRLVRETPSGRKMKLEYWRNGKVQTTSVMMSPRQRRGLAIPATPAGPATPFEFDMPDMTRFVMPDVPTPSLAWRNSMLGIDSESISSQLAEYFGVKQGVLIRSVQKDSTAGKAGLKAGDVLVKVEGSAISNPRDISSALRGQDEKQTAVVTYVRKGKEQTANLQIPQDKRQSLRRNRNIDRQVTRSVNQ